MAGSPALGTPPYNGNSLFAGLCERAAARYARARSQDLELVPAAGAFYFEDFFEFISVVIAVADPALCIA